jgi:hypothetical protein
LRSSATRIWVEPASKKIEIGRGALDPVLVGDRLHLLGIAADQHRIGHHAVAVRQGDAALVADGADRAHEVLVVAHAAGDAVHDDAEALRCHVGPPSAVGRCRAHK